MGRYINGFNVSMFFHIKGKDIEQLRRVAVNEGKAKKGDSGYYWYDLDWLLLKFCARHPIPAHLIKQ